MLGGARSTVSDGASSDAPTGTFQLPTSNPISVQLPNRELGVRTVGSWEFSFLDPRAFRIFQRQLQLPGKRIHGRPRTLPRALAFEAQVTNPATPGSDDAANGPEIRPVRMLLIEPADDVGRDAD